MLKEGTVRLNVLIVVLTDDKDVVQINKAALRAAGDLFCKALEGLCCIAESEWHPQEFKQAKWGTDICLVNILLHFGNLVIGSDEINPKKTILIKTH